GLKFQRTKNVIRGGHHSLLAPTFIRSTELDRSGVPNPGTGFAGTGSGTDGHFGAGSPRFLYHSGPKPMTTRRPAPGPMSRGSVRLSDHPVIKPSDRPDGEPRDSRGSSCMKRRFAHRPSPGSN